MKKILLPICAFLVVATNASENPFDIDENSKIIEQDDADLLTELNSVSTRIEKIS